MLVFLTICFKGNMNRTRMTLILQIITDKISENLSNPCNRCAIKNDMII